MDMRTLESRRQEHRRMLKHATVMNPQEKVEISDGDEVSVEAIIPAPIIRKVEEKPVAVSLETVEVNKENNIHHETAAIIRELNLDPAELYDKFALEQSELYTLVYKIKELHLKRLLSTERQEFESLSAEIKQETLAAGRPEARSWLESQLNGLTREAAEYKLKLVKSLQSMHFDDQMDENARWLQKTIDKLALSTN
jgi:hypothetical protein